MEIQPVILSGGAGTRLWPASTSRKPKQFLSLLGRKSLLQETMLRIKCLQTSSHINNIGTILPPIIVGNVAHKDLLLSHIKEAKIDVGQWILEPVGRNTSLSIALAAFMAPSPNHILLVLPCDHHIENTNYFAKVIARGAPFAKRGKLITFGIAPHSPNTNYGYIQQGKAIEKDIYEVKHFKEKPNQKTAEHYFKEGSYSWNGGMFMFQAKTILEELETHCPSIFAPCKELKELNLGGIKAKEMGKDKQPIWSPPFEAFKTIPSLPIDISVMEKTNKAIVLVAEELGWNDVGSWDAFFDFVEKDEKGNVCLTDNNSVLFYDTKGALVYGKRQMILAGLDDVVVVEEGDNILVIHKNHLSKMRDIIASIPKKDKGRKTS